MILDLRDIAKQWAIARTGERVTALGSINLDVAAGEFLIFLGPSGCGKSTLLQIVADLERPSGGVVRAAARGADGEASGGMSQRVALANDPEIEFTWGLPWIERVCCPGAQRS